MTTEGFRDDPPKGRVCGGSCVGTMENGEGRGGGKGLGMGGARTREGEWVGGEKGGG